MAVFKDGRGNVKFSKVEADVVTALSLVGSLAGSPVLPTYTVAELSSGAMAPAANVGRLVRCSNGDDGNPCLALSNGTAWLRISLGDAISAS